MRGASEGRRDGAARAIGEFRYKPLGLADDKYEQTLREIVARVKSVEVGQSKAET